jgi:mRNA-degrading endonuclease RelE of RelBE toxin-antitoxin system
MIWGLVWTPRALKDLRKLDPPVQARIVEAVERYARTGIGDVVRLTDVDPPEHRLRVGDWRVRFRRDPAQAILIILRVLRRDQAY